MRGKAHFYLLVFVLAGTGVGLALYKANRLGFPLTPGLREELWIVEAKITYTAFDGPVKISLAIPEVTPGYTIQNEDFASMHYGFTRVRDDESLRAVWSARQRSGPQTLYYRVQFSDFAGVIPTSSDDKPTIGPSPFFAEPYRTAADALIESALAHSADIETFTSELLKRLNLPTTSQNISLLTRDRNTDEERTKLALNLLARAEIPARVVRGLFLKDGRRHQLLYELIEVFDGTQWLCFNQRTGASGLPKDFVIWQRGGRSLIDLEGGEDSRVVFSVIRDVRSAFDQATQRAKTAKVALLDFSIYSLPIEEQNAFKLLLLVPIGSLIVVIMRNVIGIATSGTFMPILIALAFKQTELVNGVVMFCLIVGAGLLIRFYLSRLNLLLVPRISAVMIVVIILMAVVSILSYKLGLQGGLRVTFFPMIIIAWTIERMSILWEEEGHREALKQGAGSLLVATVAYQFMDNSAIEHLTFTFPELLLAILAVILLLGNYTGYRLTEFWRFTPMVVDEK